MPYRVLISDKIEPVCPERFRRAGFLVDEKSGLSPSELEGLIGGYHGLVVRSATQVTAAVLSKGAAGRLMMVARAGAGVDNIDVAAAEDLGIMVANTPGQNANAVAELAISFMIILSRNLGPAMESMKAGRWDKKGLAGTEVRGKTLGLLGMGAVGRLAASKAMGLGLGVIAHDPLLDGAQIKDLGAEPVGFEELLKRSDYLSLHLPKTPETADIIGVRALSMMKKGAYIINCARGGLIDETALYSALSEKRLAGAAVDVFLKEPPDPSPLFSLPNFVAVPHLGASTEEAQLAVAAKAAEVMIGYLNSIGAPADGPSSSLRPMAAAAG
jgi:D-3-phosphoglycerate dehydrogenase